MPPEVLIVDDFQPNLEIYGTAALFLSGQMRKSLGQAVEGIKVTSLHPDDLTKDIPSLAHRLRACVLLVLDLHFDDGVKTWTNGYELLAYAVEAAPWLGGVVLFVTQTGHNPQRSVYYTRACEAIREIAELGDSTVRLLGQIEPDVYPIEIDGGQRRVVPSFGEHSDPAHKQWWWGLSWTMEKLLRNRINAMESWLGGMDQFAKNTKLRDGQKAAMASLGDHGGDATLGTDSGSLPVAKRYSSGGRLLVATVVGWVLDEIAEGDQTTSILEGFVAVWNQHGADLRPVLVDESWKKEFHKKLPRGLMDKKLQLSRGEIRVASLGAIQERVSGGWDYWCGEAGVVGK